jgi:hypothetical protein
VGEELPGYGHIGADNPGAGSDCWGCHGFSIGSAAATDSGPTAPFVSSVLPMAMTTGTDTPVTLIGSGFTNTVGNVTKTSTVILTADDGSSTELTPYDMDACSLTVTIPGTTDPGNYTLQAVKEDAVSSPVNLSIKPLMEITGVACASACSGPVFTITGSGFGAEQPAGSEEEGINVMKDSIELFVSDGGWSDTKIKASGVTSCRGVITVNSVYGSATWPQ